MSILTVSVGVPLYGIFLFCILPILICLISCSLLYRIWSNPEIKAMIMALMKPTRYIIMDHTTYGYVRFHSAEIGDVKMEKCTKNLGIKFIPRDEGHVEQSANFRFIHTIMGHPYPVSPLTAYAIEGCCKKIRDAGLPLNINELDALFRCRLDETSMVGYYEYPDTIQATDDAGNPLFSEEPVLDDAGFPLMRDVQAFDDAGFPLYMEEENQINGQKTYTKTPVTKQVPVMSKTPIMVDVTQTAQFQLSADEFKALSEIQKDLEHTFIGYDHLGGSVFAWQHVADIVSLTASIVSVDVLSLVENAKREGALKSRKKAHDLMFYAILFVILCIGAVILKIGLGSV